MSQNIVDDAYQQHYDLLQQVEHADDATQLVPAAETLIERVRRTGAAITAPQTRDYLSSMLNFWANWVYDHTRVYPSTDLYPAPPPSPGVLRSLSVMAFDRPLTLNAPVPNMSAQATPSVQPGVIEQAAGISMPTAPVISFSNSGGVGILMVSIGQPVHGSVQRVGESVSVTGMYANLRPGYALFVTSHGADGAFLTLNAGIPVDSPGAMWQAAVVFEQGGTFALGVAVAITPDAIAALNQAHSDRRILNTPPSGSLGFTPLCIVTVA